MLLIIRGAPGSGKSTLASELISKGNFDLHYEADLYFIHNGVYVFNPAQLKDAHEWCQFRTKVGLSSGCSVIVSNTTTHYWELDKYLQIARDTRSPVCIIHMTNEFESIHEVPQEKILEMRKNYQMSPAEFKVNKNFTYTEILSKIIRHTFIF